MSKRFFLSIFLFLVITPSYAAYEEIECSNDKVFSEYSCNQCFDWWLKAEWENLWLLIDKWANITDVKEIVYKEEQKDPYMVNLSTWNVTWVQTPDSNNFWEYTDEFNNLYSEADFWYILDPGKSVIWLKSTLSHAFNLEKNTAKTWDNIGMLVYPIVSHNILADWEVSMDENNQHLECVLFKSWKAGEVVVPETPKNLPKTGPAQYILLLFVALIWGFWLLKFRTKS